MLTVDLAAELQQSDILRATTNLDMEACFNFVSNSIPSY